MSRSSLSDKITQYGFARFCSSEEYESFRDGLHRALSLPHNATQARTIKVHFDKNELVVLSTDPMLKLTRHDQFDIVSANNYVDAVYLLSRRAGWNQTLPHLKLLTSQEHSLNLLAVFKTGDKYDPLGSGMVISSGPSVCWIGMILVHPELRRQGIAAAITEQCIELARLKMNHSVVGLDATPDGMKVYQKLGFQSSFDLWRSKLKTATNFVTDDSIEIVPCYSVEEHLTFLQEVKLEQKLPWLMLIQQLEPGGSWVAKSNHQIVGLMMTRPGRVCPFVGPLIATSMVAAKSLMAWAAAYWKQQGYDEIFVDIPENHFKSLWEKETVNSVLPADCILGNEIQPQRRLIRMYEVITDKNYTKLADRFSENNRYLRSIDALTKAKESKTATLKHMELEKDALQFIFATGGPEVS